MKILLTQSLIAFLGAAVIGSPVRSAPEDRLPPYDQAAGQGAPKFLGAMTCSGPACHGKPDSGDRTRSQQTEFVTWSTRDKHHQAHSVLANEQSRQIARLLKIDEPAQQSTRCLNCHSMNVLEPARRGQDFKLADGVSCDGCHGPAERWLGTHLNEPYSDSVVKGMNDIRNPLVRAEMCVSCHVGNRDEGKTVDHEMLAAGHPPLAFELDSFSRHLPPHWRPKPPDPTNSASSQLWAIGQLVALRTELRLLEFDVKAQHWPEYSHFDCAACHHELADAGWRKRIGPRARPGSIATVPPGRPTWNASQFAVLSWVSAMRITGAPDRPVPELGRSLPVLERALVSNRPFGDMTIIASLAESPIMQLGEHLEPFRSAGVPRVARKDALEIVLNLCEIAPVAASRGPSAAQQLADAIRAILRDVAEDDAEVASAVDELQTVSSNGARHAEYDPDVFLRRVAALQQKLPKQFP